MEVQYLSFADTGCCEPMCRALRRRKLWLARARRCSLLLDVLALDRLA